MRIALTWRPLRDASAATALLLAAVFAGSRGGRDLDAALFGYLGATLVATFATAWRVSAFWRRPASALYARAAWRALRSGRGAARAAAAGGRDLGAQTFLARRSRLRWAAHLALSLGTLASFAITLPLVFGWLRFAAVGETHYRPMLFGIGLPAFPIDGVVAWPVFHGLAAAGVAVAAGSAYFLATRLVAPRTESGRGRRHVAPLVLLLVVALSGLALPATRRHAALFAVAARLHEAAVVVLLVGLPFSKLSHVLVRPLQIGVRVERGADVARTGCLGCGAALAPAAQLAAVEAMLADRGGRFAGHRRRCPACRRRLVAAAQARLLGAPFHPALVDARRRANARS